MIEFGQVLRTSWLVVGVVFLVALVGTSYWWARGNSRRGLRVALAALRWTIIAAVMVCLLNPEWVEAIKHQQRARFAVLVDTSRSMGTTDVGASRLATGKR